MQKRHLTAICGTNYDKPLSLEGFNLRGLGKLGEQGSQCRGREFDPPPLHTTKPVVTISYGWLFSWSFGKAQVGNGFGRPIMLFAFPVDCRPPIALGKMVGRVTLWGGIAVFSSDDIQRRLRQSPFIPVRIIISSGQTFDVLHPDLVLVGRRDITIGMASTENPTQYEQTTRVPIMHVTALEDLPTTAPASN